MVNVWDCKVKGKEANEASCRIQVAGYRLQDARI